MTMTGRLIHLTAPHKNLFFFHASMTAILVLLGILVIITGVTAEPDSGIIGSTANNSSLILDIQAPLENTYFLNLPQPPSVIVIGSVKNSESLRAVVISSPEGSIYCGNTSFISCTIPAAKGLNRITVTATDSNGTSRSVTRNFTVEYGVPDLPPRITISGKITKPDGSPVEDAIVNAAYVMNNDTHQVTAESEADGSYRINNARGFRQIISIEKKGYANVTKELVFSKNVNTADFTLEPKTKPASGFTSVLCFVAILGTVLIICARKGQL
jgi:hypothetical protein